MNLVYKHGESKHFKIIRYPDGQQNIELDMAYFDDPKQLVTIRCSIRNFPELEVFLSLVAALRKEDFFIDEIEFIYLFGMRSDRSFARGQPNYFKDVIAPIINNLNVRKISVLTPHSCLSLQALNNSYQASKHLMFEQDCTIVYADASAPWHDCMNFACVGQDLPHFFKSRRLEGIRISLSPEHREWLEKQPDYKPILIKDDLCDGGATFIAIADYLKREFPLRKRWLYITHGLFTKGVIHVAENYDKVITTNSYQEFTDDHPKFEVIDVWKGN